MLRRETESVLEKQMEILKETHETKGLNPDLISAAQKIEGEVMKCFKENQDTPLDCLEKVRQMQVIARHLSLQ